MYSRFRTFFRQIALQCFASIFSAVLAVTAAHAAASNCIADKSPNSQPATSQPVPPMFCLTGAVGQHYYFWNIPPNASGKMWTVKLEALPGEETRLLVQSLDKDPHQGQFNFKTVWQGANTASSSDIASPALSLQPGLYGIVVATRQPPGLFRLFVSDAPAPAASLPTPQSAASVPPPPAASAPADKSEIPAVAGNVADASNTAKTAFAWQPPAPIAGTLSPKAGSRDSHFIALSLDSSWANKRFDLVLRAKGRSESLDLIYAGTDGEDLETRTGTEETRLPNLALAPRKYFFRVSAVPTSDLPYTLSIENVGPLKPGEEHEPNDTAALAQSVPSDGVISGTGDGLYDLDYFRFHVSGKPQLWTIQLTGPSLDRLAVLSGDGDDDILIRNFPNNTGKISRFLLDQGDHILRIQADNNSPYTLRITPEGPAPVEAGGRPALLNAPVAAIDEIEPNDTVGFAMPLALNSSRGGLNDFAGDKDFYRFTLLGTAHVRLTATGSGGVHRVTVGWGSDQRRLYQADIDPSDKAPQVWEQTLGAGDYYVLVTSNTPSNLPYRIKLETLDPFGAPAKQPPAVTAALVLDTTKVAAYGADGQVVHGHLDIAAKEAADIAITPYAEDERWVVIAAQNLHLAAGEKKSFPVTIKIAPNAWANHPVQVAFNVADKSGAHVTAACVVAPDLDTAEVFPFAWSDIPDQFAGGLDVAWSALGAMSPDGHSQLDDGMFNAGGSAKFDINKPLVITLAGNAPAKIVGVRFVPAGSAPVGDRLHRFQLLASKDGTNFSPVLTAALSPRDATQDFVLPAPVDAHILKFIPLDGQDPKTTIVLLAEFEAIASPASKPLGDEGLDVAPILRGGHFVRIDPYLDSQASLSAKPLAHGAEFIFPTDRKAPAFWTIGFLDDRPIKLADIGWQYPADQNPDTAIPSVDVSGSLQSPDGPWVELGGWQIAPTGNSTPFHPTSNGSFRYLRFEAAATKRGYNADLPIHMSVHEMPIAPDYHSVLALPVRAPHALANIPANVAKADLSLNKPVKGMVRLGVRTDHWTIYLPDETQNATFTLENMPAINAVLRLRKNGTVIPWAAQNAAAGTVEYTANIGAGHYDLDVSEPPFSVALLWDTSQSVSGWTQAIVAAVRSIAQDAVPGREEINLFPFHDPTAQPLLKNYTGDPATLFSALQAYNWRDYSSGAEGALIGASQTLAERPGRRGIIMLTDAESTSSRMSPELWQAIAKTGPEIFALQVPTNSTGEDAWLSRNLMTDWATATGGFETIIGDQGGTEAAFQQAAASMRGWAPYKLTATVTNTPPPPPKPGLLAVKFADVAPSAKPALRTAVALVLDASGSMLQMLNGHRKIDIARNELDHIVRDVMPEQTPITLRVYGQGGRGSCRSDLMMQLAPLNRAKAEAIVAKVRSTDGARTATAASLRATASDLAAATGTKRVILITDGGENCGGNVEQEISGLKASGINVQLDIVGFAIDTPETGKMFAQWARLGGGQYYQASDASTLDTAMRAAVKQRFEAVDASGVIVASGDVGGDVVSVPPGHYTVRLKDRAEITAPADVKPETPVTIMLAQ